MVDSQRAANTDLGWTHLLHPLTPLKSHEERGPTVVVGGEGIRIRLADGRTLIDGLSGLFNINVGHGRTEIGDAVAAQMRKHPYYPSFWGYASEPAITLAERLAKLMPTDSGLDHFLFTTGGSDANEINFRFARFYHAVQGREGRRKILSRRAAYHGATRAAGSATRIEAYHVLDEPDPLHIQTDAPYCFRCLHNKTYPGCGMPCVEDVATVIEREGPDSIAAIIVEPVQGTGGIIVPPPDYFSRLQEICQAHDILIIFDEVITGFGRTGKWFGMDHWGVTPDLVSIAKGITSGYLPLGGIGMTNRVYETIRDQSPKGLPFMAGLTYNNHASTCAAAHANLDIVEREGLVDNAAKIGAYLRESLEACFADHPLVGQVRGIGMLAAVEFAAPGTTDPVGGKPMGFPPKLAAACMKRGLIARAMWENLALAPPLCTTREEIDEIIGILSEAFQEVAPRFA